MIRREIKSKDDQDLYFKFMSSTQQPQPDVPSMRFNSLFEREAFSLEINVMDMVTDGQLRRDVTDGTVDIESYCHKLGATSDEDRALVATLCDFARILYRGGKINPVNEEALLLEIESIYGKTGAKIDRWQTFEELRKISQVKE